jgi:tetratricopeptide (TPR) repeat protein
MLKRNLLPFILLLLIFLNYGQVRCYGQYPPDSLKRWITVLSANDNSGNALAEYFTAMLILPDTASMEERQSLLEALEKKEDVSNPYFTIRRNLIKVYLPTNISDDSICKASLHIAYELGDQELIAFVSWQYGRLMSWSRNTEAGVMYSLNAAEIYEKIGKPMNGMQYFDLGQALYSIREYEKSLYYSKLAAMQLRTAFYMTSCVNTIALNYQKMGRYDSALLYYDSAWLFNKNFGKNEVLRAIWKGILSGNKGQVYFLQGNYQQALPLFVFDFRQSADNREYDNAANSLQWAAKTNLVLGNSAAALQQIREAFYWMEKNPEFNYLQNLYRTAEEIYQKAGMKDSALYFGRLYMSLHDSIEASIANSRLEISQMKLENERNYYNIKSLKEQRQRENTNRNLAIAGIILLAIFAILYLNNKRVKTLHQNQIILEKNKQAEMEMAAAKEQLETFTHNLVEKTALIEQLQEQLNSASLTTDQQEVLSKLQQATIITDDQWADYKKLLEKIYPGFFQKLKEGFPGITVAEQRMAALSKLKLNSKEIASMLGISLESVRKTRQRLRQRLSISGEINLEEYIASL